MEVRRARVADGAHGLEVTVQSTCSVPAPVADVVRAVRAAVTEGRVEAGATAPRVGEISVTLVDDAKIQEINRAYLGHDRPTDVIAFALGDGEALAGDVYIGFDQACRQASEWGERIEVELMRLAVHGVLHLLGHDHVEGAERVDGPMFTLQERIVSGLLMPSDPT